MLHADIECLEARQLLSSYFINAAAGNDLNTGRSAQTAWQTLAAINDRTFKKGDRILLTGTFSGQTLLLGSNATGLSVNSYIQVGTKNAVKVGVANAAVFSDVTADGIDITTSGITIQNIDITAAPAAIATGNYNYGVYLHNDTSAVLKNEVIDHVTATGFSYSGLCMQGWNTTTANSAGFSNVLIENSDFYDNQVSGIFVATGDFTGNEFQPAFPANYYVNSNLTIKSCQAYGNAGNNPALKGTPDGVNINQGNYTSGGIFISSVNGAKVQNCTAYDNCFASLGSVGLWAFDATRVNFQNDESYDNKSAGNGDGDGFDFDHGVTDSIMQQDYSHGNVGAGFLIATTGGSSNDNGDTIRYCISDFNGAGIYIQTLADVPLLNANIYNNTVLTGDTTGSGNLAMVVAGDSTATDSVNVLNNIFYSAGPDPLVLITAVEPDVHFEGNDYWLAGAPGSFAVTFNAVTYTSLADWSAASGGEETLNGKNIGLIQDPLLIDETPSDLADTSIDDLALSRSSPLRKDGLNLASHQWAGTAPYKLNAPYNLAGKAWNGIGNQNFFGKAIDRLAVGAG
jgi:hypothetical protein